MIKITNANICNDEKENTSGPDKVCVLQALDGGLFRYKGLSMFYRGSLDTRVTMVLSKDNAIKIVEFLINEYNLGTETTETIVTKKRNYTMNIEE